MRTFLFFLGSTLGSIAFQATIAIWPDQLHKLAWLVPWIWVLWAVIWIVWLATHPSLWRPALSGKQSDEEPPIRERAREVINKLNQHSSGMNIGAPITQNARPSFTANPNINITVNPALPVAPTPVKEERPGSALVKAPEPKPRPVIEMEAEHLIVELDDYLEFKRSDDRLKSSLTLVVSFYYNPIKSPIRPALYVKASVAVTNEKTGRRYTVSNCPWIGEALNHVSLKAGDKKYAVVFWMPDKKIWVMANNRKAHGAAYYTGTPDHLDYQDVPTGQYNISVSLLWSDDKECEIYEFKYPLKEPLSRQ